MNDARGVGSFQSICDFDGQRNKRFRLQGTVIDHVLEGGSLKIFHGDEDLPGIFPDIMNGANIGMIQR